MFDSHQELCVPGAGLCIVTTSLCLSFVKLCALFVVMEVVFLHKNTTSKICEAIMKLVLKKKTTAVVLVIWDVFLVHQDPASSSCSPS